MSPPQARLLDLLAPILARVAALAPHERDTEDQIRALEDDLEERFPRDGEAARAIGEEIARGVADGWLCNRGEPQARFSRLAKPTDATHDLSIDVVSLRGEAIRHTHPRGEVTLGFGATDPEASGQPQFDGRPPGWVFLGPGSTHTPRVTGQRMHLIYFLPGGEVVWHPEGEA